MAPWVKAQDLLPGRGEAPKLLIALTPSPTPVPTKTPMPIAIPLQLTPTPTQGPRVIASDNFSTSGRLLDDRVDPQERYKSARDQGSFVVVVQSNIDFLPVSILKIDQSNAALSVIASIVTNSNGLVMLACRDQGGNKLYQAIVDTKTQLARIRNAETGTDLLNRMSTSIRKGTAPNRIKFACIESDLSLTVNDTLVGSVSDTSFTTGNWRIAASKYPGQSGPLRAVFDDLIMTER